MNNSRHLVCFMFFIYNENSLNEMVLYKSDELDQQFTLKELIAEASRHQAYKKKILYLVLLSFSFFDAKLWGRFTHNASTYFYIGYFATPLIIQA